MMGLLAENQFTITKKLLYEGRLLISRDGYGKFAKKITLVLIGIWLLLFAVTLITKSNPMLALGELLIVTFLCLWINVFLPKSRVKSAFKGLQQQGDLTRTVRFYASYMEAESENRREKINYDQVEDILQGRNLLVLICNDGVGVMLALDGFTVGDAKKVLSIIPCKAKSH